MSTTTVQATTDANRFEPGELVNVHLNGVRYESLHPDGDHMVVFGKKFFINVPASAVIERVAPKEWPPQTGDIWVDRHGQEYLGRVVDDAPDEEPYQLLIPVDSADYGSLAEAVAENSGPMLLARRRGWTPADAADEAEQLGERAATIAGLHALADLIAARTDIQVPYAIDGQVGFVGEEGLAEAQRIAASLGVELSTPRPAGVSSQQWCRTGRVRFAENVTLTLYAYGLEPPAAAEVTQADGPTLTPGGVS